MMTLAMAPAMKPRMIDQMICNMGQGDLRNRALPAHLYQINWTMSTLFRLSLNPLSWSEDPLVGADLQA
jgi:hypothetical protein